MERRVEVEVEVEVERKFGLQRFYWLMRGTNERTHEPPYGFCLEVGTPYNIVR